MRLIVASCSQSYELPSSPFWNAGSEAFIQLARITRFIGVGRYGEAMRTISWG